MLPNNKTNTVGPQVESQNSCNTKKETVTEVPLIKFTLHEADLVNSNNIQPKSITKIINRNKVEFGQVALKATKSFKDKEEDKELHNLAAKILRNTLDALKNRGIEKKDMSLFIKKMQEQTAENLYVDTSKDSEGKNAGFTAWKDKIKESLLLDNEREVEKKMKNFQTISAEIQKQTKGILHTRVGRKYDSGEFMMRSYRLIQLLNPTETGKIFSNEDREIGRG